MKIGMFTDGYTPGITGVATSVESSVRTLTQMGHYVYTVAPKYPNHQDDPQYPILRIRSVSMPARRNIRVATYVPGTSMILASQLDLDIIHGHAGGPISMLGWEVAKIKRIPYVFTYHTMINQYAKHILQGRVIKPSAVELATRIFCNSCDQIIAPTEKIKLSLIDQGVKKSIVILPTGIDINKYQPQTPGFLHQLLQLDPDKKIILYLGRLNKEKSIDLLIKAFARTVNQQHSTDLVVAGDGGEKSQLQKLAAQLNIQDRVHFPGFIDPSQTPQALSDAYLSCLPSITETQGLAVPESLACGTPALVARDKAFSYAVKHRQTGLYANNQTAQSYATQILWAINNPDRIHHMSTQARQHITTYSLQHTNQQLEQLYQTTLKRYQPSKSRLRTTLGL